MTDEATTTTRAAVDELWQGFRDACIPKEASDAQMRDMRMAFYAGALALLSTLSEASDLADDEADVLLSGVREELSTFAANTMAEAVNTAAAKGATP